MEAHACAHLCVRACVQIRVDYDEWQADNKYKVDVLEVRAGPAPARPIESHAVHE